MVVMKALTSATSFFGKEVDHSCSLILNSYHVSKILFDMLGSICARASKQISIIPKENPDLEHMWQLDC